METFQMTHQWMDKQNMVYLYSGILFSNKNEILIYATVWMNLKNIMLIEKQGTKDYILYHLYEIRKIIEMNIDQWF